MRTAVFALTPMGVKTAQRVRAALPEADIFVGARCRAEFPEAQAFSRLSEIVGAKFHSYDALVFLMATGIVVRTIAPLLRGKLEDPAILVLDEQAHHVISLLSGHVGGANALTRQLAQALGSDPVITTATDVEGRLAPDAIAGRLGLFPQPHNAILSVNRALLSGREVVYCIDTRLRLAEFYAEALRALGLAVRPVPGDGASAAAQVESEGKVAVLITDARQRKCQGRHLRLCPRRLIAGVGCRRGVAADEIEQALAASLSHLGLPKDAVDVMATTEVKKDEAGLRETAKKRGILLHFYDQRALQAMVDRYGLQESPFVRKTIGVGNVAEAAALAEAGSVRGRLALGKTKFKKVTVALVWQTLQS